MRAGFANKSLVFALLVGAGLALAAFAGLHRASALRDVASAPVPYQQVVEHFQPAARIVTETVSADASAAGAPLALRAASSQPGELALVPPPPRGSRGPSQLIRTASVSLEVSDVARALRDATLIADEQLGDVIGLNDDVPGSDSEPHTATMAMRVPEYRFDQTLDALGRLGKVTATSVSAQDVSDQIVDAQARLRNLRRTETDMLAIMDRSGNIDQVLNVTQQISSVREQIERLDAQIQSMQYQVSYSTISITFTRPAVVTTPTGLGVLGLAWKNATGAARDFAVTLVSIVLWLLAFSPYVLLLALLTWLVLRRVRMSGVASAKGNT